MKHIEPIKIEFPETVKPCKEAHREYLTWLEKIMHFISHDMRQHVVNISGLSNLLSTTAYSSLQLKQITSFLKKSASLLDYKTRSLTGLVFKKITFLKENDSKLLQEPTKNRT